MASFPDPWTSEADEVQAMRASSWEPSDSAFAAVTSVHSTNFAKISTLGEFLGAVIYTFSGTPRPKGSVGRINLLTHGNPGLIGFNGTVVVHRDASGGPTGVDVFFAPLTPVGLSTPVRASVRRSATRLRQASCQESSLVRVIAPAQRDECGDRPLALSAVLRPLLGRELVLRQPLSEVLAGERAEMTAHDP